MRIGCGKRPSSVGITHCGRSLIAIQPVSVPASAPAQRRLRRCDAQTNVAPKYQDSRNQGGQMGLRAARARVEERKTGLGLKARGCLWLLGCPEGVAALEAGELSQAMRCRAVPGDSSHLGMGVSRGPAGRYRARRNTARRQAAHLRIDVSHESTRRNAPACMRLRAWLCRVHVLPDDALGLDCTWDAQPEGLGRMGQGR
eukprot:355784-Chlamydomonas_euryale.AAC.2